MLFLLTWNSSTSINPTRALLRCAKDMVYIRQTYADGGYPGERRIRPDNHHLFFGNHIPAIDRTWNWPDSGKPTSFPSLKAVWPDFSNQTGTNDVRLMSVGIPPFLYRLPPSVTGVVPSIVKGQKPDCAFSSWIWLLMLTNHPFPNPSKTNRNEAHDLWIIHDSTVSQSLAHSMSAADAGNQMHQSQRCE